MFSAHGPSKTSVFPVFLQHFTLLSFNTKLQKHCILQCFAPWNLQKSASKMVQKPSPKTAFPDPWFFGEFPWFFDDFLTPPRSPKNAKTPAVWRILVKIHFSPNWKSSRCKNAPKCRRERRYFRRLSKNIERGGVGGTGSTPGSKLALATLLARRRRIIEWAIALVPPTPPFWLKGGSEREVVTRFPYSCGRIIRTESI